MNAMATEGSTDLIPQGRMVTKDDLAQLFDVHPSTILVWVRDGRLPKPVRISKSPYWKPETIAALLDGRSAVQAIRNRSNLELEPAAG
jgi:predicted DNA-binding transcriptional regulator AlpA